MTIDIGNEYIYYHDIFYIHGSGMVLEDFDRNYSDILQRTLEDTLAEIKYTRLLRK